MTNSAVVSASALVEQGINDGHAAQAAVRRIPCCWVKIWCSVLPSFSKSARSRPKVTTEHRRNDTSAIRIHVVVRIGNTDVPVLSVPLSAVLHPLPK